MQIFGKRGWRTIAGAIVAVVLAAAAGEAFLRYGLGLGKPVLVQADPQAQYIVKPDQTLHRFFGLVRINHEGMRSPDILPVRDPRALRIMFVGDSLTYGTSRVSQDKIFTDIVRRKLPDLLHRPVEVLNASASGWAPDNEVGYIREHGVFGSDMVVLVLNSADVAQPVAKIGDVGDDLMQIDPPSAFAELYTRYIGPRLLGLKRKVDPGLQAVSGADDTVAANLADLDALAAHLQAVHTRLVILYLPIRSDIPSASARPLAILKDWTAKHGVTLLDFTPVEAAYPTGDIVLDGVHFNVKGNRIVADALVREWPR